MSCVTNSVCKLCRRENMKLFLKGDRCYTDKCAFERRPYPPGQHGQSRLKFSEFALQLREKQKAKRYYGLSEKQFRKYFHMADASKAITGTELLKTLELRLDNVVYTLGFANSRREARQLIGHNHFLVNGKRVNIASAIVKKGDVIEVAQKSKELATILSAIQAVSRRTVPSWLDANHAAFKGTIKDAPTRDEVTISVEESMIVEYYSR
ncbi:MAG: 30S ribosomal protein S4 [Bdellovibrionales bacterium RIFCSPHIGHO2_01_FULL_40_29]|nr:MAG: 30S ribosomal protein S4 [Bdellovibrionales bacterium RIFCSPHIGHO2_01_FULL_40_29]OFZ33896.1 MAG: 30S ribosomal protein S4 [Bdellovibrionales bacterium RIFCSPHIGHO2_02_FULL_40_15]